MTVGEPGAAWADGVGLDAATAAFVRAHRDDDVRELALHARRGDGVDLPLALDQIAGRRTAVRKLPTWAACEDVVYPPHLSMEQCSSEATARYKARLAGRLLSSGTADGRHGARTSLLDLTGGFGVDFSFMARVFDEATYVERDPRLCALAAHNLDALGLGDARVVCASAEDHLGGGGSGGFDGVEATLVFLDPARRDARGARTYAVSDCTPDALALLPALLAASPHVMVKLSPMLDWHSAVADFAGHVHEVHIVSVGNECKELLLVLGRERCDAPSVVCAHDGAAVTFRYDVVTRQILDDEFSSGDAAIVDADAGIDAAGPADTWRFLYEPNASIMKAGCFALLSARFPIHQIAPNTHLFVSRHPVAGFPGRMFAVDRVSTLGKRELKTTLAGLTHANIAVRNVPISVDALRRKLGLRDGGDTYLFAVTDARGRRLLLRTHKFHAQVRPAACL